MRVPAKVDRILLGEGRLLYTLALLEGKEPLARIAGWQGDLRKLDPQTYGLYRARFPQIDRIPLIGNTSEDSVSPEKVLMLKPDIAVFSLIGHGPGRRNPVVEQLEKSGVPVVFVDFRQQPVANTVPSLRVMGQALGRQAEAERFIAFYEAEKRRVTEVAERIPAAERPSVFLDVRAGAFPGLMTAGKGNLGELVTLAGGANLGDSLVPTTMGEASIEAVVSRAPQVYIATGTFEPGTKAVGLQMGAAVDEATARAALRATALRRPEVAALPAVRSGRVHGAWHHFYNTAYHVVLLQAMARWQHPVRYAALDPHQTWREMHERFLAVPPEGSYWVSLNPAG